MPRLKTLQEYGNQLFAIFDDGFKTLVLPFSDKMWKLVNPYSGASQLLSFSDQMVCIFDDGTTDVAYNTHNGLWVVNPGVDSVPVSDIIDNLLPGFYITNPGGTVASGWQWHIDNTTTDGGLTGRGGDDLSYSYGTNFYAPGAGTVSHFDVSGVGMVVKLILDTPATRTKPQYVSDAVGPMVAIWFEHCSASYDGHKNQGDLIGKSGDGYGAYGAHLHVHGLVDTGNVAGTGNRCCFWNFL